MSGADFANGLMFLVKGGDDQYIEIDNGNWTVKRGNGKTPNDIEMITGATISSRAVIQIINQAIARWQPLMDAYHEEAKP